MKEYIAEFSQGKHGENTKPKQEMIRCKDCKHYAILEDGSNELICDHRDGCICPTPEGFCNYAEPKRKAKT